MARPFLGTVPFAVRLTPLERAVIEAAAKAEFGRSARAWCVGVLWERAVKTIGNDSATAIRVRFETAKPVKIRRPRP